MTFNPMFRSLEKEQASERELTNVVSYKSVALKTLFLIFLTIISATLVSVFGIVKKGASAEAGFVVQPWLYTILGVGGIVSFLCVILSAFFPRAAVFFAPVYALFEGAFVGVITVILSAFLKWGAFIALSSTIAVFFVTLLFNMSASFRAKNAVSKILWVMFVMVLLFTVAYLIVILAFPQALQGTSSKLNHKTIIYISIAISVFLIIYGTLLLSLQFTYTERLVMAGADKKLEWQAAFGILFALVMIYVEIVRLLILISALKRD